ncbi:MAG: hypothetical protein IT204_23525 [Fimbriimonadaceae bacterium]|nr:hypothetical protein [Fimbriimonadaceae bacterium]
MKLGLFVGATLLTACTARDLGAVNPPYPRIGNCYGAGLGWRTWEQGREYWSKVDLFIGGGYDLHYDWTHARWARHLANYEANARRILEVNPHALFLPYVDVVEGPYDPQLPAAWWDLRDGQRWSGWPGMDRINTRRPDVLQYNLDQVREQILGRGFFDGVFYDCWGPDPWLVPRTAQLRNGQAVVMVNDWNLPSRGFGDLNGCLAEDEINRVITGKVDFEEFLGRYLRWCRESRRPVTTMLVCCPQGLDADVWGFQTLSHDQKVAYVEQARQQDQRTLRFGLTTTLLGDGYFGYDAANIGRGRWWWYPEYDAPLGYPRGAATKRADGLWQREFDGGLVLVNGSRYDTAVELPRRYREVSSGRVGTRFTLPLLDGRILLTTDDPPTAGDDQPLRLTRERPAAVRAAAVDGQQVVQTPGGLDLWFAATGELKALQWRGQSLLTGGWPLLAAPPFKAFTATATAAPAVRSQPDGAVELVFQASLAQDTARVTLTETVTVGPDDKLTLRFDYEAATDLQIRLWRHWVAFPVSLYRGCRATAEGQSITLPADLGTAPLLPASRQLRVAGPAATVTVDCSLPLSLVDHRQYGSPEYLLAGYPLSGAVPAGRRGRLELRLTVSPTD